MIQSHYFLERMAQERPQELLEVARSVRAARAARQARTGPRALAARGPMGRAEAQPPFLVRAMAGLGMALVHVGQRMQRLQDWPTPSRVSAVVASCVICGEPLPSRPRFSVPGTEM